MSLIHCIEKHFTPGRVRLTIMVPLIALVTACATPKAPYDYTAFKQSRPKSIVVLPPVNETPEVKATMGVMTSTVHPLAEAGYYVMPVSVVAETFRQNGMTQPEDIHALPFDKLHGIFGADAALYMHVKRYGTTYMVIRSDTTVVIDAKLVDLRSGATLWAGTASASSAEQSNSGGGGLAGALIGAVVNQIVNTTTDAGFTYAGVANQRLLGVPVANGMLYGPRSVSYQKD
jgi:hypothetical protein